MLVAAYPGSVSVAIVVAIIVEEKKIVENLQKVYHEKHF